LPKLNRWTKKQRLQPEPDRILLTKPLGSLGRLEEISIQLAGIYGQAIPKIKNKIVVLAAADHGVVAEGVSAYRRQSQNRWCSISFVAAPLSTCLSRHCGAKVVIVDCRWWLLSYNQIPNLFRYRQAKYSQHGKRTSHAVHRADSVWNMYSYVSGRDRKRR